MRRLIPILVALAATSCASSGTGSIGTACTDQSECASNMCLLSSMYGSATGWTGGTCTATCSGTSCDGGTCVALEKASYCLATCTAGSDCRSGYVCDTAVGACLPDCNAGFACGGDRTCQSDGTCRSSSEVAAATGKCETSDDCKADLACTAVASKGCTCATVDAGRKMCRPACATQMDCPKPGMGIPPSTCNAAGYCQGL